MSIIFACCYLSPKAKSIKLCLLFKQFLSALEIANFFFLLRKYTISNFKIKVTGYKPAPSGRYYKFSPFALLYSLS